MPGLDSVPRPIRDAAENAASKLLAGDVAGSGVVTALVGWGVLSAAQGDAVAGLLGLIPGVVALVGSMISRGQAAREVFTEAEPKVTPVVSPRADDGSPLVKAVPRV